MSTRGACRFPICHGFDTLRWGHAPLRVLRQVVGDLKPRRFVGDESVSGRPYSRIVVERGEGDAVPRWRHGIALVYRCSRAKFVDDRRAADATETAETARRRFVERHQLFSLYPLEITLLDARTGAKGSAMLFASHRALEIVWCPERPVDLELNATAETTPAKHGHTRLPLMVSDTVVPR